MILDGEIIKWKEKKRVLFKVSESKQLIDTFQFTLRPFYNPSPKSLLRKSRPFKFTKNKFQKTLALTKR